jgi:hypothetical protein
VTSLWTAIAEGDLATPASINSRLDAMWKGDVFNVKAYGALGDNSTDDTASVQSCIDAALVAKGTVFFPPGTYKVTGLSATNRIRMTGSGADTIIRNVSSTGSHGIHIYSAASTIDGWNIADLVVSGETGSGDAIHLRCCHRGKLENVTIPSSGSGGVTLNGSLLNTLSGVHVTTNHPYTAGTRKAPSYGFFAHNGDAGTCAGNGSNANTFDGCTAEGIRSGAGVGYQLNSDANIVNGGASEGNNTGVGFGAGVHSNTFLNVYFESNASSDVTYVDSNIGTNTFIQCVGAAFGTTSLSNVAIGDGAANLGGLHFTNDPGNGIFRIGSNSWALSTNSARLLELGATSISPYQSIIPDSSSAGTIDLGSAPLPFRSAYLSGISTKPLWMGAYALWVDATGDLRIKNGAPTSDGDGDVVGGQT